MIEESKNKEIDMEPIQVEKSGAIYVWLLPLIAAVIAGWLLFKGISEAGVNVQIEFESAEGIEEKKTKVLYKGLKVGFVKKVTISEDLKTVSVEAVMNPGIATHLRDGTRFWLVRPKVSLTEVTGLDTLVSGNYIAISPGEGAKRTHFKALPKRPPMDETLSGLHLKLHAEKLGSIAAGSPVYYREIQVGGVEDVELEKDAQGISISVRIEEQYSHLVRDNSRFWNISGVDVKASLSGVEIETGSLASLLAGGISFYTPEESGGQSKSGDKFKLHKNYNNAEDGIVVRLHLPGGEGVIAGKTKVRSGGVKVGIVKRIEFDEKLRATAEVKFHPHARALLRENAKFWLVEPELSFAQLPSLTEVLEGNYISIKGGDGEPRFEFTVSAKRLASDRLKEGLYLTLIAEELGSLQKGSPVLYRQIKVGHIDSFQLDKTGKSVEIQLYIKQKYAHLVTRQSRFWNASGINLRAGLDGFKLRTESISSLVSGGVAFFNPEKIKTARKAKRDDGFRLYEDKESAEHNSFPVEITFTAANGLQEGAAVKFQGLKVGRVKNIELTGQGAEITVQALMHGKSRSLVRKESKFWVVQPEIGLARTANMETLVSGRYISLKPGRGAEQNLFTGSESAPLEKDHSDGLKLTLVSSRLGSIKRDDPVYYRQIAVGKVIGSALAPKNNAVFIKVDIEQKYAPLVRDNSEFWSVSGIRIDASLFGGVKVETESVEALLSGGLAFATPDSEQLGNRVSNHHTFELNQKMDAAWEKWKPEIVQD